MLCTAPSLATYAVHGATACGCDHTPPPLSAQDKLSISAALTTLRQPRFSCVEALGLGKATKLGKTGAASLAKVCPRLRELDLSSLAVSRDDCASLHAALPELAGLSFHVDYSQSNALGIWGYWPTGGSAMRLLRSQACGPSKSAGTVAREETWATTC